MIVVSGVSFDISNLVSEYSKNSVERQLLNTMAVSSEDYLYDSLDQLKFELALRKEIVNSSIDLYHSELGFAVFKHSKCNPVYWNRTDNGGFLLKTGANPANAINDIFINGSKYATECATAMMIVYYKAILNLYGKTLFNRQFFKIYLMDWDVTEPLLKEVMIPRKVTDILLGDRGYFINPDFDPETPEWRGENVIILPNSLYYGHGIGITTAARIIQALNSARKENTAQSAYFYDSIWRPDFKKLFDVYHKIFLPT